ncbi:MAG TPA: hypothetical protein VMU72_01955 [Gaiellaceae bacterium]|nr:hypothetical protein [Gaiellaceae bacterium]
MKRILTSIVIIAAAAALAVSAAAAPASKHHAVKTTKLTIVMHDPGCHWFAAGKGYAKTASVKGIALVRNIDEAAMIFKGPAGYHAHLPVGKSLKITKPGVYHITMVKQAPDDNHLVLRVTR